MFWCSLIKKFNLLFVFIGPQRKVNVTVTVWSFITELIIVFFFFFISVCNVFYKNFFIKLSFNRKKNIVLHCIVLIDNFLYNLKKNDHLTKLLFSLPCLISYANVYTVWQLGSIELKFNAKYQQQWRWITRKVQTISAILVQCTYIKYGMRCLTVQRRSEHWICKCIVQGCTHGSVRVCVFVCVFMCVGMEHFVIIKFGHSALWKRKKHCYIFTRTS